MYVCTDMCKIAENGMLEIWSEFSYDIIFDDDDDDDDWCFTATFVRMAKWAERPPKVMKRIRVVAICDSTRYRSTTDSSYLGNIITGTN